MKLLSPKMKKYVLLLGALYLTLMVPLSFADPNDGWLYEFVDANLTCKMPGKGNLRLISMVYRVCDYDHVSEKGMIDSSMFQLGATAGRLCGGAYDVNLITMNVSQTEQQAQQEHARALNDRRFRNHETFPFLYVYSTRKCR
jgi:hypothetical protein